MDVWGKTKKKNNRKKILRNNTRNSLGSSDDCKQPNAGISNKEQCTLNLKMGVKDSIVRKGMLRFLYEKGLVKIEFLHIQKNHVDFQGGY